MTESAEELRARQVAGNQQLAAGNFVDGWRNYSLTLKARGLWRHKYREGSPPADLRGSTVAICRHAGLGDELIFSRFVPQFRHKFAVDQIVYATERRGAEIFRRSGLFDDVVTQENEPLWCSYTCLIDRLPLMIGMSDVSQIPPAVLIPPSSTALAEMRERLAEFGDQPLLGLTWRAGNVGAFYKEIALSPLASAIPWAGHILVLQRDAKPEELSELERVFPGRVHDFSGVHADYERTMALVALIDEYIAVSNTAVHLRAAVGKTARALVSYPVEWRWMAAGKESPWFPGTRLYRQDPGGDWSAALADLGADMRRWRSRNLG